MSSKLVLIYSSHHVGKSSHNYVLFSYSDCTLILRKEKAGLEMRQVHVDCDLTAIWHF